MTALALVVLLIAAGVSLFWLIPAVMVWPEPVDPWLVFKRGRCALRRQHQPVRRVVGGLGGFRCLDCGFVAADLEEMGYEGGGYVATSRRTYSSRRGGIEREEGRT